MNSLSTPAKNTLHTTMKGQFLSQHLHELIYSQTAATNFIDFFPTIIIRTLASAPTTAKTPSPAMYVGDLCKWLKLQTTDQIFIALSLANSHINEALAAEGDPRRTCYVTCKLTFSAGGKEQV